MLYFCTLFDSRYIQYGLTLYGSLIAQERPFHIWILCMDQKTHSFLQSADLPNVNLLTIDDIASLDPDILTVRGNRSVVELYFSSKAFLCSYLFRTQSQIDLLTYLDADMFFFRSPDAIVKEMEGFSVGLTPHRFPAHQKHREQYGFFNAGFISIRRDTTGLECLDWWRKSCFDWCHDYVSEGRFADQGYLSMMPARFPAVRVIPSKGFNAAPWNISQFDIAGNTDGITIDGDLLVLYHFHGIKWVFGRLYDCGFSGYQDVMNNTIRSLIYRPYLDALVLHNVPERTPDSARDIRAHRSKFARLRSDMPVIWNTLNTFRMIIRGIRYKSLITVRNSTMSGAA